VGRSHRSRPSKLPKKLRRIRLALKLSQTQMVTTLNVEGEAVYPASISLYELGKREPPLCVLLRYAEIANICLDTLADDRVALPRQLPTKKRDRHY